jgi:predicted nucleotidyltransferase
MGHFEGFNEGDYIQTTDGLFFAVKGSTHPDGYVIGILRYLPDPDGDRVLEGVQYRRVYDIGSTTDYLRGNHPEYVNYVPRIGIELQSVPACKIARYYEPRERLNDILSNPESEVERVLADFVNALSEKSRTPADSFGVSGSLLIGLQTEGSDIDINVYGQTEARRVYGSLVELRETLDWVRPLEGELFDAVLKSRWGDTGLSLGLFSGIESSKVLHGTVRGREYFVRLLIPDDESVSEPVKRVTIRARVTDASRSIFNPCIYGVSQMSGDTGNLKVTELKSYRGKFTEQAHEGDLVEARGTIEKVQGEAGVYYRLMLGASGDYLLPLDSKDNY